MRKNIDITKEQLTALKIISARRDSNPKRYIETLIARDIEANKAEWEFFEYMDKHQSSIDKGKKKQPITVHYRKD